MSSKEKALPRLPVPFVLVTGGKGGVGKTTLAANLAVQLAREGRRVLAVDLDLGLANLHVALGLASEYSLEDALLGERALEDCVAEGPEGVHVLPAGSGTETMGRLDDEMRARFVAQLCDLALEYDVVVGDSAAGIGPDVLGFAAIADRVLVVTTPEIAALTDAYGLIKSLDQYGTRTDNDIPTPEVVVNMAPGLEEARRIAHRLRGVCERFLTRSPRAAGWLPKSRKVVQSWETCVPFASSKDQNSLESHCLGQIAERVQRMGMSPTFAIQP